MIYVASSWRNTYYPGVVDLLRQEGFTLYDFRHPAPGDNGFHWSEIDPAWEQWTPQAYREALRHPLATHGFRNDMTALRACDTLVLVLPCGRSAHLELGYAIGAGKRTIIYYPPGIHMEPELMYKAADHLCLSTLELLDVLGVKD
jgi:hypothetical protein